MTLEDLKEFTLQYGDVYFHPVSLPVCERVQHVSTTDFQLVLISLFPLGRTFITVPSWLQGLLCSWWTML